MAYQPTTLAAMLRAKAPDLEIRAVIGAWQSIKAWSQTAGLTITWQASITQYPTRHEFRYIERVRVTDPSDSTAEPEAVAASNDVAIDGVESVVLTSRASSALVDANPSSFHFDPATSTLYVSLTNGATPAGRFVFAGFDLRVTTGHPTPGTESVDADGRAYRPDLLRVPDIVKSLPDPFFGVIRLGGGQLSIAIGSGRWDPIYALYRFETGEVRIIVKSSAMPDSEAWTSPTFRTGKRSWADGEMRLDLVDANEQLNVRIPRDVWVEADADLSSTFYLGGDTDAAVLTKSPADVEALAATSRIPTGQPKGVAYSTHVNAPATALALAADFAVFGLRHHANYSIDTVTVEGESVGSSGVGTVFKWYATADRNLLLIEALGDTDLSSASCVVDFSGKMNEDGTLMTNPATIVSNLVTVEAGVATGFDSAILARSEFRCDPLRLRIDITTETRLADVLAGICRDTLSSFYQTDASLYAFNTWHPTLAGEVAIEDAWGDFVTLPTVEDDPARVYQTVTVPYGYDPARPGGAYLKMPIRRADSSGLALDRRASWPVPNGYIEDEATAFIIGSRYARLGMGPPRKLHTVSKLRVLEFDVDQAVRPERARFPAVEGTYFHGQVTGLARKFSTLQVELDSVQPELFESQGFLGPSAPLSWASATAEERRIYGYWTDLYGFASTAMDPESFGENRVY